MGEGGDAWVAVALKLLLTSPVVVWFVSRSGGRESVGGGENCDGQWGGGGGGGSAAGAAGRRR